ncbi:MAG: hypothetical protein KDA75_11320 [Planctomycetaceae bacterium]|nr:hypothetical protein [Planctomycetaceae bacterium]
MYLTLSAPRWARSLLSSLLRLNLDRSEPAKGDRSTGLSPGERSLHSPSRSAFQPSSVTLMEDGWEDLRERIREYVEEVPAAASPLADAKCFRAWLLARLTEPAPGRETTSTGCADALVEDFLLARRLTYARFVVMRTTDAAARDWETADSHLHVYLNPIHAWARRSPPSSDADENDSSSAVIVYAAGRDTQAVGVTPVVETLLRGLQQHGPMPVRRLIGGWFRPASGKVLAELADLSRRGVIAVG